MVSLPLSIDIIRLNLRGQIKIQNILTSPSEYDQARHDRQYWSHNAIDFYIEQTYRLGIVLLQMCSNLWIPESGEGYLR